ncbi:hypothetical protein CDAR_280311 [Caerostris darwini]|uniref:Uncharacterized protein n=1 Tax=Caerostris darwini TaxID=1538125 RepID=A0AAV4WI63_9ARAC|nr:hypothetical protein CDAR_280311 [Caerostris darwini]
MDTTMDKSKCCLTNVYIYLLVQQANTVIWVEPSYHPTKHGGGDLKRSRRFMKQTPERSCSEEFGPCEQTCGLCDSVFSYPLASVLSSPLGKNKTLYARSTIRRLSKTGVWAQSMAFCRTN